MMVIDCCKVFWWVYMEMVKKACDYCYFLELDSVMNNWTLYWWKFNKKETKSISWNFDHKPVVLTKYKVANLPPLSTAYDFFQKIIYKKTI